MGPKRELLINGKSHSMIWTDEDLEYLKTHWANCSQISISDHLRMAPQTVKKKAMELGLQKSPDFSATKLRYSFVKNYKHGGYKERSEHYQEKI